MWYGVSSFILGLMLYFPIQKIILFFSISNFQKKLQRQLKKEEMTKVKKKISLLSAIISMTFAFLYNRVLMYKYFGG